MLASILIIAVSVVLLSYWFRYSCLLLLRNSTAISDRRFHFVEVQNRLRSETALDPLQRSLDRDYRMLMYLVQHAPGLKISSVEDKLLVLDYRLMQAWYRVTRTAAPAQARRALSEMASILAVLAGRMGAQADLRNEA